VTISVNVGALEDRARLLAKFGDHLSAGMLLQAAVVIRELTAAKPEAPAPEGDAGQK